MRPFSAPASWLLASAVLVVAASGHAQEAGAAAPDEVAARATAVEQRLEEAQEALQLVIEAAEPEPEAVVQLEQEIDLLKQLTVVHTQLQAVAARTGELEAANRGLRDQLQGLQTTGPADKGPYSFLVLDHVRDELGDELAREQSVTDAVAAVEDALERARNTLGERESARRRAREAADTNRDEDAAPRLAGKVALADLEVELAAENVRLREAELAAEETALKARESRIALLRERIQWIARDVLFTRQDLDDQLFELSRQESELKRQIETLEVELQYAESRWFKARERLERETDPAPALREEVEARRLARSTIQQRLAILQRRLARLADVGTLWSHRFEVAADRAEPKDRLSWLHQTEEGLEQVRREGRMRAIRVDDLRQDLAHLERQLQALPESASRQARWVSERRASLEHLLAACEADTAEIQAADRLHEKLLREIRGERSGLDAGRWMSSAWRHISGLWTTEIFTLDDRPITVGKIITGIALLIAGYGLSRFLSRILGLLLLVRVGVDRSAAAALQSVAFYFMVLVFTLVALRFVHVPLTAFTILGGAAAIGVGFGSQNVVNNFISGLILLAERPVKVGDMIQIDDLYGNVVHIGPRSTRVRTGDDLEIIVPNSEFLERRVSNWTLTSDTVRTHVPVGVVYGSPVELVRLLLERAVLGHPRVLPAPPPVVWFTDFGSNSLDFEVHFWIRVQSLNEWLQIKSEIRFTIDQLFRAARVVIAFPQRDVHLDTSRPLDIRLLERPVAGEELVATDADQDRYDPESLLGGIELFSSLTRDEIARLGGEMKKVEVRAGQDVVRQGDEGDSLYIVEQGLLDVSIATDDGIERIAALVTPKQFFGEMSLLTGEPRSATVTAVCDTTVHELDREMLAPVLKARPEIVDHLSRKLAGHRQSAAERQRRSDASSQGADRARSRDLLKRIQALFGLSS